MGLIELLNDKGISWARLNDFSGGENRRDHAYDIPANQLQSAINFVFRGGHTARVRPGQSPYIDKDYNILSAGCRGGMRYTSAAGTKKIVINSGGTIYSDSDDGQFDSVATLTPGGQGFIHFAQHKDTVLVLSKGDDTLYYHPGDATDETYQPNLAPLEWDFATHTATESSTGGYIEQGFYRYRVTFDIKHDDDFLGETAAAGDLEATAVQYDYHDFDADTAATDTNKIIFKRPPDAIVNAIPTYVSHVNFYRSPPLSVAAETGYPYTEDTELFFVGSVDMATVRAATAGDNIFTDDGKVPPGRQIQHSVKFYPPRARYCAALKGRLYLFNCSDKGNFDASYTDKPHTLYWSRFSSRSGTSGMAPMVYGEANSDEIEAYDGEGGMGVVAYKGKGVLLFKPNRTVLMSIGDDNIDDDIPEYSTVIVDENLGCIAPETIRVIKGIPIWLSHIGPVYFDGTNVVPLGGDLIHKALIEEIPAARRPYAVAGYDGLNNEYQLFYSATGEDYNLTAAVYNFNTGAWGRWNLIYGVGTYIEVKDPSCSNKILWGFDDASGNFDAFQDDYLIVQAETGYTEGNRAESGIAYSLETGQRAFGKPHRDKEFPGAFFEVDSGDDISLDVKVEAKKDTDIELSTYTISAISDTHGNWGVAKKSFKQMVRGRRIGWKLSGTATGLVEIISILQPFKDIGVTSR